LTSLPKLTPVKNVEEEKGRTTQDKKIITDRSRGMVLKAGTQLNDEY